jgi:hypothetical protein
VRAVAAGSLLALALLGARPARADEVPPTPTTTAASPGRPRWVPTVGAAFGSLGETLRLKLDGVERDEDRSQFRLLLLAVGLAHPVRELGPGLRLDGHASLGFGPTFTTGHWHLVPREDVTVAYQATRWLTLRAGLGLGLGLDATSAARSHLEFALPLGVTFFDLLEVVYRPFVSAPLGAERRAVFGGDRELFTSTGPVLFDVQLRVRLGRLGW